MKSLQIVGLTLVAGALALAAVAVAAAESAVQSESGSGVFKSYCASCHGTEAKGDGPVARGLRIAPADLTLLARHNHGKFDPEKVRRSIDGRETVRSHGTSDMPVWGDAFKNVADGYSEERVKARIDALVDYLKDLQQK